jgi:hypothetical protein
MLLFSHYYEIDINESHRIVKDQLPQKLSVSWLNNNTSEHYVTLFLDRTTFVMSFMGIYTYTGIKSCQIEYIGNGTVSECGL